MTTVIQERQLNHNNSPEKIFVTRILQDFPFLDELCIELDTLGELEHGARVGSVFEFMFINYSLNTGLDRRLFHFLRQNGNVGALFHDLGKIAITSHIPNSLRLLYEEESTGREKNYNSIIQRDTRTAEKRAAQHIHPLGTELLKIIASTQSFPTTRHELKWWTFFGLSHHESIRNGKSKNTYPRENGVRTHDPWLLLMLTLVELADTGVSMRESRSYRPQSLPWDIIVKELPELLPDELMTNIFGVRKKDTINRARQNLTHLALAATQTFDPASSPPKVHILTDIWPSELARHKNQVTETGLLTETVKIFWTKYYRRLHDMMEHTATTPYYHAARM